MAKDRRPTSEERQARRAEKLKAQACLRRQAEKAEKARRKKSKK